MAKLDNLELLKILGSKIAEQRIREDLEIEDVVEMTGLTYNTISKIENGSDTYLSNFIWVSLALNIHPKELLDIDLVIRPRYELTPKRKEKSRLTKRIEKLIHEGFFKSPRKTNEVLQKLEENYQIKLESKNVSTILKRFAKSGDLNLSKERNRNLYFNK
ncbi:helix-turn-helix domain-containing protein [Aestuariibaculum sp. M13]|uniref:helix-turn-helix domain-containing protein n=1 Tax=Aestuariibaculum sp. M13 TaxID=2967132 RepID=UPI002159D273|nr:helix-turn-helix transcriptional regulator [Aestuariibaculum sp. M13]MCR8667476.1 helix-turn-helix domain-containing protein [Aestuariibaculum sp. M13]